MAATAVLVLLFIATALANEHWSEVLCRNKEYCSVGQLRTYVGPLDSASQTKEAFEATAWKKELILFSETRIEPAAHAVDRCRRAGYGHVLPVLVDSSECARLARLFITYGAKHGLPGGNISCGWYRTHDESGKKYESGFEYLKHEVGMTAWWRKWFTAARAVALGYNVMAIDEDVLPLGDWYTLVRSPPASEYVMISQSECPNCINGGFTYVQNAASNGPAAFLLFEALHMAVRWAEDASALRNISRNLLDIHDRFYHEDQCLMTDVMLSCLAGRPLYLMVLGYIRDDEGGWAKLGGKQASIDIVYRTAISRLQRRELWAERPVADLIWGDPFPPVNPPQLVNGTRLPLKLVSGLLKMPHSGGVWPREQGGYLFGPPGPYTLAYRKAFTDLGVPLPPNPDDPATEAQAKAIKPEYFALTGLTGQGPSGEEMYGSWLEHNWFPHGRLGFWHLHLKPHHTMGFGHSHAGLNPAANDKSQSKKLVMLHTGNYNWRLAARLHGGPARVFTATRDDEQATTTLARVVAYAPGVIHYNLTKEEFIRASEQLARVAVALRAAVAWPAPDCSSDWLLMPSGRNLSKPIRHTIPWVHIITQHMIAPFGRSLDDLKCEWTGFNPASCLHNHGGPVRGLLAVEFEHLLELVGVRGPEPQYIVRLQENATTPPPPPLSNTFARVSYGSLVHTNIDMLLGISRWGQPLWLDRLVELEEMPPEKEAIVRELRERCHGLNYYNLPPHVRETF